MLPGGVLIHAGRLGHLGYAALQHLQIREDELQVDGLYIAHRVNAPVHVHHIVIIEAPDHMDNGVALPDVGQELISQALTLGRALDQARNIHEFYGSRRHLFGVIQLTQRRQALIRHSHHAHVGVYGAERIIGGLSPRPGQ